MADPPPLRQSRRLRGEEPPGQVDYRQPTYTEPHTNPHVEDASASQLSNARDTFSNAESLRFNENHVPPNITIHTTPTNNINQPQPTNPNDQQCNHSIISIPPSLTTQSHSDSLLSYSQTDPNTNLNPQQVPNQTPTTNSTNSSNYHSTSSSSTQFASITDVQQLRDQITKLSNEHNNDINNITTRMTTMDYKLNTVAEHVNTIQSSISTMTSTINDSITNAIMAAMQTAPNPIPILSPHPTQSPTTPTIQPSSTNTTTPHNNQYNPNTTQLQNHPTPINSNQQNTVDISTVLHDYSSSSSKLVFQTYNGKTDIQKWQSLCLLALSTNKNPYYKTFVKLTPSGKRILDLELTAEKKAQLFNLTVTALDPKLNLEFITTDLIETADGLHLWELILHRFKPALKGTFEKEDLKIEFRNMHKNDKETNTGFLKRIEQKLAYLQLHNLYLSDAEKAVALLEGLRSEYLIQPVVQLRADGDSTYDSWIKSGDLQHTLECATRHIAQYVRYNNKVADTRPKSYKTALGNNGPPKTSPTKPTGDNDTRKPFIKSPELFKADLAASSNIINTITKWKNKSSACSLHPKMDNHTFIDCGLVRAICDETGNLESLAEVLKRGKNDKSPSPATPKARRITTEEKLQQLIQVKSEENNSVQSEQIKHDMESEYDSGSQHSSSTFNDTKNTVEPYSMFFNSNLICRNATSITSILRPPKSYSTPQKDRTVKFHSSVTNLQLHQQHQHAEYIQPHTPNSKSNDQAIADSGATHDMTSNDQLFESIIPLKRRKYVTLGDDKTTLIIKGYGFMNYLLNGKRIRRIGYYVPNLGTTLLSIRQHMKYQGCFFHAENETVTLAFPSEIIHTQTDPEFTMSIQPAKHLSNPFIFNESEAIFSSNGDRRKYKVLNTAKAKYISKSDHISNASTVRVKKLISHARLPKRATEGSIGFDITSAHDAKLEPQSITKIHTGLAIQVPEGHYLRIAPKSSMSIKGITVEAGVIDPDYRGEIIVVLRNHNQTPIQIRQGQKAAQLIFEQASTPCMMVTSELTNTSRDSGGFGSTGQSHYSKLTRDTAVECAMRASFETNAQKLSKQMFNQYSDPNDDNQFMHSSHEPLPPEKENTLPTKQSSSVNQKIFNPSDTIPPNLPQDTVNSSLPKHVSMSKDFILQATGFHKSDFLLKHFNTISQNTVSISKSDKNPHLHEGETATMRSRRRNTTLAPTEHLKVGEVYNMDIAYGPTVGIGGIKYALVLIDRKSKRKFIYGLKNLKTSIRSALQQFLLDAGPVPRLIRTDFDHRLIGGQTRKFLLESNIKVEAAPPRRQHQNGLIERHWQNIATMARNWLKSQLLPSSFWFFAVKRAVEISNILPVETKEGIIYTPHERAYGTKVDYRNLFPMFSKAYIKTTTEQGGSHKNKFSTQTLKTICVGKCPKSNSLLFYHPDSKQLISDADGHRFDNFSPSGPQFGLKYDGSFIMTRKSDQQLHQSPAHEENDTAFIKINNKVKPVTVLSVPIDDEEDKYTVQEKDSGVIREILPTDLLDHNPNVPPSDTNSKVNHMYPWIKDKGHITLYLSDQWTKPKQGIIHKRDNEWYFTPGRENSTNKPMLLAKFEEQAESMIHNRKLFEGWKTSSSIINARLCRSMSNIAANLIRSRHVSAVNLIQKSAPSSLLQHAKLHPDDKQIWDKSYFEEYEGLQKLNTWKVITEDEYHAIKTQVKRTLPTMAIATVKTDGEGNPIRAKYRIVALGNLDPHSWSKQDCFAPVLSQQELRLLTSIAARNKCIPKSGDVSQAFCQSFLPEDEVYVCRPPSGCPITPKNSYWKLLKTLYGLKRSPRHWYDLAKKTLLSIGFKQCDNAPCLFVGQLIKGEPPIYLGLYVDDFIYFSKSKATEQKFEQDFSQKVKCTFTPEIDYFLGIKFTHTKHKDGNISIKLSQEAYIDSILEQTKLNSDAINTPITPYRNGYPIDSIPDITYDEITQKRLTLQMQTIVGSLNWLSISTRPDIATVTSILAKYCRNPSQGHIDSALRVIKYLKGTKTMKLCFSSKQNNTLESFIKFPLPPGITNLCDSNWGPQDQSKPNDKTPPIELDQFKTRSISGYITWLNGPVMWTSKRQTFTARSSAEAEIYATDECAKNLLHLINIISDLGLTSDLISGPITIWNDNNACVCWSKNTTTKGLRHVQIRENAIREGVSAGIFDVKHISGKDNPSDIFTKEDKDVQHFVNVRDSIMHTDDTQYYNNDISTKQTSTMSDVPSTGGCQVGSTVSLTHSSH
jgi:deoxyuridine 5'-triphosphate nucleotidohydrolase